MSMHFIMLLKRLRTTGGANTARQTDTLLMTITMGVITTIMVIVAMTQVQTLDQIITILATVT
jgi:hypothetical protein